MQAIFKPIPAALLGLVLSLAASSYALWAKASVVVERIAAIRREAAAKLAGEDHDRKAHGWDFWTIEMENLANELEGEKAQLQQRSAELDQREARIAAERQELAQLREAIEGMRREIDARVISIQEDESKNLRKLAQLYATLDAPQAVAIFKAMDDNQAAKILSLMKPDVTGPIFDEMAKSPDGAKRAAALTEKLQLMKDTPVAASP